ncbi:hypothetical protein LTS17_009755 [Exophiala oligosperma]
MVLLAPIAVWIHSTVPSQKTGVTADPPSSERVPKASKSTVGIAPRQSQSLSETTAQQTDHLQCSHNIDTRDAPAYSESTQKSNDGLRNWRAAPSLCSASISLEDPSHLRLPAFIKALDDGLDSTDLDYLRAKKALSLPSKEFRDVCVARYLEFAHPLLPLLDKRQLLSTLREDEVGGDQISLTLFNAVMLSGVTFVEDEWIVRAGFESRQAARKTFFSRAKVLFNTNVDLDRFVACQVAVLMSTWYPGKHEKADAWFWTGTAVSLAYSIHLHLEPDESHFSIEEQRLRRRLWWGTFARDQKVALALGRPHRSTYYNVRMLSLEDLDDNIQPFTTVYPSETRRYTGVVENPKTQSILGRLCIEHMKLCVCIASFVTTIFKCRRDIKTRSREDVQGHSLPSPTSRLNRCTQDFALWYRGLAADLHYERDVALVKDTCISQARCLAVHKSTVHILYHVSISALYRLKALSPSSTWRDTDLHGELHSASQRILRHTAWELTRTNQELCESGFMPYLSTGAVGGVVAALVIHLLDVKAPNETVRRAAVYGIQQCKQFLLILKNAYNTAVDALDYLEEAEKQDANIPASEERDMMDTEDAASQPFPVAHAHQRLHSPSWVPTTLLEEDSSFAIFQQTPTIPTMETSPFKDTDEIFWQSFMDGASTYEFHQGTSLPLYDLGFSSNDIGNFEMPSMLS